MPARLGRVTPQKSANTQIRAFVFRDLVYQHSWGQGYKDRKKPATSTEITTNPAQGEALFYS